MNLAAYFEHWGIAENPFRGEEARQDPVFLRLGDSSAAGGTSVESGGDVGGWEAPGETQSVATGEDGRRQRPGDAAAAGPAAVIPTHSDFEKIVGDFRNPASSIVFGEKGSGKTAIRLQMADRLAAFNRQNPESRCLLVAYDDLNPILDRFVERTMSEKKPDLSAALAKLRLVDHIDAILSVVVPRIADTILRDREDDPSRLDLGPEPRKSIRRHEASLRQDLLLLQALYDRQEGAEQRTRRLRRTLRLPLPTSFAVWTALAWAGWILPATMIVWPLIDDSSLFKSPPYMYTLLFVCAAYGLVLAKRSVWDRLKFMRLGHRVRKQVRVTGRTDLSYARSLSQLPPSMRDPALLPMGQSDDPRYAALDRLRRVLRVFDYASVVVIIDRVDEPTVIAGDAERMKSFIWPMLNNKFLQQVGLGVKMLLPIELRHALFRESAAFFQEARLDKQNLIERLSWTGATLYDLCTARLRACLTAAPPPALAQEAGPKWPISLIDLFAEDVSRQDLIDALEQMRQPRDAFKMLYQCLTEHCAMVTQEQAQWRIPRHVLEQVRRAHAERVRQLASGVRPA